jgi:hypothetical protein
MLIAPAIAALALAPASAQAGTPGRWEPLNPPQSDLASEVGWVRAAPDQPLQVAWEQQSGDTADVWHRTIAQNGTLGAATPIVTGYATIGHPALLLEGATLRAIFGGQHSTDTTDPVNGIVTATSPDGGATWGPATGTTPDNSPAGTHSGTASAITTPDGSPLTFSSGSGYGVVSHLGLDPARPLVGWGDQFGGDCCTVGASAVRDLGSGALVLVFGSLITGREGIFAQQIDPAGGGPAGTPVVFPGVGRAGGGDEFDTPSLVRTPVAARVGGGVYVIHAGSAGTGSHVVLWRVGDARTTELTRTASQISASVAATPDGRIWALWSLEDGGRVNLVAVRSNPSVTKFGDPQVIAGPASTTRLATLDSSSQPLRLDVIASAFGTDPVATIYHTQVLPPLTLAADRRSFRGGQARRVTFKVTDVGVPVAGVSVGVAGDVLRTAQNGKVRALVPGPRSGAKYRVTATKTDYMPAKLTVTILRAPRKKSDGL